MDVRSEYHNVIPGAELGGERLVNYEDSRAASVARNDSALTRHDCSVVGRYNHVLEEVIVVAGDVRRERSRAGYAAHSALSSDQDAELSQLLTSRLTDVMVRLAEYSVPYELRDVVNVVAPSIGDR